MLRRCWLFLGASLISIGAPGGETQNEKNPGDAKGLQPAAVFTEYFPASGSAEVVRRLLSPLANREIARVSANSNTALREQAIDLSQETYAVYVPAAPPPQGYALLSFIAPWQKGHLPAGWASVLDKHGMIFVSASNSGNRENILDRRIPLALLGAHNIMQRYPVDRDRVYVGGMSGGSRVAMRVAMAYPDLFHGAMLNAGSDPIGTSEAILPPADLFQQFQSSRLVYVTGSADSWNIDNDIASRQSMNASCVFGTITETMQRAGHEIASPAALDHALGGIAWQGNRLKNYRRSRTFWIATTPAMPGGCSSRSTYITGASRRRKASSLRNASANGVERRRAYLRFDSNSR